MPRTEVEGNVHLTPPDQFPARNELFVPTGKGSIIKCATPKCNFVTFMGAQTTYVPNTANQQMLESELTVEAITQ